MKPHPAWQRLTAAARRAPDPRDTAAPFGFAARVAARVPGRARRPASIAEQFSLRVSLQALGAAAALAVAAAAVSFPSTLKLFSADAQPAARPTRLFPAASSSPDLPAPAGVAPADAPAAGDDPVAEVVNALS